MSFVNLIADSVDDMILDDEAVSLNSNSLPFDLEYLIFLCLATYFIMFLICHCHILFIRCLEISCILVC